MSSPFIRLFSSELKLGILTSLLHGDKNLSALRRELGSSGSTIIHALTDLESINLTVHEGKVYKLTPLGAVGAQIIEEFSSAARVLEKYQDFWLGHDVSAIPANLMLRLGALEDSTLIQNEITELNKVHSTFQRILLTSKDVHGISPIFHPDFIGVFQKLLTEGSRVELILTSGVLEKTLSMANLEQFVGYVNDGRLRVFLMEDSRVALTVTENSFSMGLFNLNEEYDYSRDLISNSRRAIEWGSELFQHYLKDAGALKLEDLGINSE